MESCERPFCKLLFVSCSFWLLLQLEDFWEKIFIQLSDLSCTYSRKKAWTTDIHQVSDARAGEGVPLQSVLDQEKKDRDCARLVPHGATGNWVALFIENPRNRFSLITFLENLSSSINNRLPLVLQIKIWFQNRRMKWKKENKTKGEPGSGDNGDEITPPGSPQ